MILLALSQTLRGGAGMDPAEGGRATTSIERR